MKRMIIRGLLVFLLSLSFIEVMLRVFDPLGAYYFDNIVDEETHFVTAGDRGYAVEAGVFHFQRWTLTELPGYLRAVPDNAHGDCRVTFIGDSVTWGSGVDDAETWVNLVAKALPGIDARNTGIGGYNSEQVRLTKEANDDGDAFVYLIIDNDPAATHQPSADRQWIPWGYLGKYIFFLMGRYTAPLVDDYPRFYRDLDTLASDPRVVFVAFDVPWSRNLAKRYAVNLIPMYRHILSRIDSHPDAEGNREIAASILPIVKSAVRDRCTAIF